MDFKDKRILITGGTKGLGRAIALSFAHKKAWICVTYATDDHSASETESLLKNITEKSLVLKADVSSKAQVEGVIETILDQWDFIDILVNNAGIIRDKMLMFMDEKDWDRVIEVNLKGTYLCSRAVINSMIGRKSGRIINMTSPSAVTGRAGQTNYSAAKGGIISFTKSLSKEIARIGITVNAVCPGIISTPMTEKLDEKIRRDFLKIIPMERFGSPDEVAEAVLYLASDKAGYITGQVLSVDGGLI